ncbi:MAG: hypothetical protein M0Q49_03275 [Porticoccaceae bacterium]|nr:hypothetical protein [Porticoccaceae bacterium]
MPVKIRVDAREVFGLSYGWQRVAEEFPAQRMYIMRDIGDFARAQLMGAYFLDLPLNPLMNYRFPTAFRGNWGESVRLFVTPQGTATIRITSPLDHITGNTGIGPRELDIGEKVRIREWAYDKIGVEGEADVQRIIHKIETFGIFARRLVEDAFGRQTPRGQRLDAYIQSTIDSRLQLLLDGVAQ